MILTAHRRSAVDEWLGVGVLIWSPRLPNKARGSFPWATGLRLFSLACQRPISPLSSNCQVAALSR